MKTNVEFIVFAIKQAKEAEAFGFTRNVCCRNNRLALVLAEQDTRASRPVTKGEDSALESGPG